MIVMDGFAEFLVWVVASSFSLKGGPSVFARVNLWLSHCVD